MFIESKDRLLVQIASYNTNLQGIWGLPQDLVDWLSPTLQVANFLSREPRAPDIVAVGFQELLPLHLGLAGLSGSVLESRNALILSQIESSAPGKEKFTLLGKVVNGGVALLVYGRDEGVARRVCDVQTSWTGCGPLFMGNKGAVGVRFRVAGLDGGVGEVYTFVNAHLTAHERFLRKRIQDYSYIAKTLLFTPLPGSPSSSPSTMYSTSHLFFFGDLNFRLALPRSHPLAGSNNRGDLAAALNNEENREGLKEFDQLTIERRMKSVFVGLREGEFWKFKCTYKYKLGEVDKYHSLRVPSWTDRILYTTYTDDPDTPEETNIHNLLYTSIPSYTTSDHKPIISLLSLPPPLSTSPTPSTPPTLRLPSGYAPTPDPRANFKRYTGRVIDRIIGYIWWIICIIGLGSATLGLVNIFIGLGVYTWWRTRPNALPY
ncbi:hypothetical protein JAAARDRAFT_124747 [Jaapia argillacea MUCL 33604]|uniref:Inositol polyphosphate-related phosphatase domain-containing protein n=1 Tax=Jaapia argillacea MUCL 33604 TaxID=933084 RepID=A0A067Q4F5_9AGAM|nr:hypothetical protein JAAARDRAFT_124747 [Jaapia argillacea MUCL 33604]